MKIMNRTFGSKTFVVKTDSWDTEIALYQTISNCFVLVKEYSSSNEETKKRVNKHS